MEARQLASRLVPVLHEDEQYLIIDKPSGLNCDTSRSAGRRDVQVLCDLFGVPELHAVLVLEPHLSGVCIFGKSSEAATHLAEAKRPPTRKAKYTAVVRGHLRLQGRKRSPPKPKQASPGRERPIEPRIIRRRQDRALVEFPHRAVRTSAIRAELQTLGLPVLGDVKRRPEGTQRRSGGRIYLHRASVEFLQPYYRKMITVEAPSPPAFATALTNADPIEDALLVALVGRLPWLLTHETTDAFRLVGPRGEGAPGLAAEAYGSVLILETLQGKFMGDLDRVRHVAKWYRRTVGMRTVYHKQLIKTREQTGGDDPQLRDPEPLAGRPSPEEIPVQEHGLRYLVRPYDGYATGLFLDQRENRRRVRELAAGRRVLNTFAYTCSFSVAAAAGEAASTVSVDISKRALEWGKRNFETNNLPLDDHVFICSEVFDYFGRARRQQRSFDFIILDPPSFARSKRPKRVFSLLTDLEDLLAEALTVLAPDGLLLLSTNNRTRSQNWLRDQVAAAAERAPRRFQVLAAPALPSDFAADSGHARSILVRFP